MAFNCSNCKSGKISAFKITVRRCKDCGKVQNVEGLLNFLKEIEVNEEDIERITTAIIYSSVMPKKTSNDSI